jgi:hypothetical protein
MIDINYNKAFKNHLVKVEEGVNTSSIDPAGTSLSKRNLSLQCLIASRKKYAGKMIIVYHPENVF